VQGISEAVLECSSFTGQLEERPKKDPKYRTVFAIHEGVEGLAPYLSCRSTPIEGSSTGDE